MSSIVSSGKLQITGGKLSIKKWNSYSLYFDGAGDYIDDFGNGIAGAFSMSAWAYIEASTNGQYTFFSYLAGGVWLEVYFGGSSSNRYIKAGCHSNISNVFSNMHGSGAGDNTYEYDEWFLITMTWDGTTLKAYKNATEIISTTSGVDNPTAAEMFIGQTGTSGYWYEGYIDEFAYWDEALSADAVTAIYNSGTPINLSNNSGNYTNSGDLQRYFRFEEGSGEAIDTTGNSNGDITGATFSTEAP